MQKALMQKALMQKALMQKAKGKRQKAALFSPTPQLPQPATNSIEPFNHRRLYTFVKIASS
ncbi:hypothetical protein myaer87_23550 [Microcystis aeruginosa NIES-87]|nr:hypothetical protein myaer87_23550 [Microcystis aeruginosa NIES-87]